MVDGWFGYGCDVLFRGLFCRGFECCWYLVCFLELGFVLRWVDLCFDH